MLQQLVIFAALAAGLSTALILVPGLARAPIWIGLPLGAAGLGLAGWLTGLITSDPAAPVVLPAAALLLVGGARLLVFRRWSWPAVQLFATLVAGSALYLVYAAVLSAFQPLGVVGFLGSILLWLLELVALGLSISYAFELLDVLGRQDRPY